PCASSLAATSRKKQAIRVSALSADDRDSKTNDQLEYQQRLAAESLSLRNDHLRRERRPDQTQTPASSGQSRSGKFAFSTVRNHRLRIRSDDDRIIPAKADRRGQSSV